MTRQLPNQKMVTAEHIPVIAGIETNKIKVMILRVRYETLTFKETVTE